MGNDSRVDVASQNAAAGGMAADRRPGATHRRSISRVIARVPVTLRTAAAILLPAVVACACGTAHAPKPAALRSPSRAATASATPSPSPSPSPSPTPKHRHKVRAAADASPSAQAAPPPGGGSQPTGPVVAAGCQDTFVPAYFYASSDWTQAIDTRPAPAVLLLNVDSGPGTSPLSHFQTLTKQAQAAGITVLGYSSTEYGAKSIASVEAEINDYKSWYGVNGIFLDLTQGTSAELSYYQTLSNYIRANVPGGVVWLNVGAYPVQSFMSVANTVMVFEGSYSSYVSDQVPGWVSQYSPSHFANVLYATPQSDFDSAVNLSRTRSRAGFLFVTDLSGSGNPYGAMPSYWSQEAATIGNC
jgi:Spherulation-specific family 4